MRELPLYDRLPVSAVEAEPALLRDAECTRCELSGLTRVVEAGVERATTAGRASPQSVCIPDEGARGGVLLVGDAPYKREDETNRPFWGEGGDLLRGRLARSSYQGPVALTQAIRCRPLAAKLDADHAAACRGYLAATIEDVAPKRILALGSWAALGLLGRPVAPLGHRGGYTYLSSGRWGAPIPVFYVVHPHTAARNRFVRAWFEEDLERALTCDPPAMPPLDAVVRVVETAGDAERAVADLRRAPWACLDVESAGILFDASFILLCLAVTPFRERDESTWSWDARALAAPATRGPLARYLADAGALKSGQNVKFDTSALKTAGFRVNGVVDDIRLWRKMLEPEADGDLSAIMELVGMGGAKAEQEEAEEPLVELIKFGVQTEHRLAKAAQESKKVGKMSLKGAQSLEALAGLTRRLPHIAALARRPNKDVGWRAWSKAIVPEDLLLRYNARDAAATTRGRVHLLAEVRKVPSIDRVRSLVVDRAGCAVQRVEEWGVPVDVDALKQLDSHCFLRLSTLRDKLNKEVGASFNPGSTQQLADLLFVKYKIKPTKLTDGGKPSTDEEVLEKLRGKHHVVDLILDYRKYSKIQSNYAGGMMRWVRPDGRIHAKILLDGAASGRASVKDPALQVIPSEKRDPEMGRMCRDVYAAPSGKKLLSADYKQVEFRVAAMLSQDPVMIADIVAGLDPHWNTARVISKVAWGIPPEQVTEQHRAQSKTVVFGALYGKTPHGLASDLSCSVAQAESILAAVLGRYKGLAKWIKSNLREAQKTGYAWSQWAGQPARRRPMTLLADADEKRRVHAENGTTNHPVQSSANEFQLASLAACVEWIDGDGLSCDVKLILPVHDSLLFEVSDAMIPETVRMVTKIMTSHSSGGVPLGIDVEWGQAWGSLSKMKPPA